MPLPLVPWLMDKPRHPKLRPAPRSLRLPHEFFPVQRPPPRHLGPTYSEIDSSRPRNYLHQIPAGPLSFGPCTNPEGHMAPRITPRPQHENTHAKKKAYADANPPQDANQPSHQHRTTISPHSGHRCGVSRRSYPQLWHRPAPNRFLLLHHVHTPTPGQIPVST